MGRILSEEPGTVPDPLLRYVRRMTARVRWRCGSEIVEDCVQEARVMLWKLHDRIQSLPASERDAYAAVSVRRAVNSYLERESRLTDMRVELQNEYPADDRFTPGQMPHFDGPGWMLNVTPDRVSEAISRLSDRDQTLLHLYYFLRFTDAEVAEFLSSTPAAVQQKRRRLIRRLRDDAGG